jgi:glycosyltransferase involved in cell wall biosynthesis
MEFPKISTEEKEFGFVCIGRISSEKRIERIIHILSQIRDRGHRIHLHIIGDLNWTVYGKKIQKLCRNNRDWISAEGSCYGEKKQRILTGHDYGIHACQGEAFGIAVAEMVKAGCIVFVPNEGGQAEMVNHPSLVYSSVEDAVKKIDTVLCQSGLQASLRNHLSKQGQRFSADHFKKGLRRAVEEFLRKMNSKDGVLI